MDKVLREKAPGLEMLLAWLLRYGWEAQSVNVAPLLGTARPRRLTWNKVKKRLARLAMGEETGLVGLCFHGEG